MLIHLKVENSKETHNLNIEKKMERLKSKMIQDQEKTFQNKKLMQENQKLKVNDLLSRLVNKSDRGKSKNNLK